MKLLIIQLARLGDIYQTWPVVRAIKRLNPQCEIHVLSRTRFQEAWEGHPNVSKVWTFDTKSILKHVLVEPVDMSQSLEELRALTSQLASEGFTEVLNLSFSPASATLTSILGQQSPSPLVVRGYTRHADGSLDLPDDSSRYFYAQVGLARANRLHLTWIFAQVAGIELQDDDWNFRDQAMRSDLFGIRLDQKFQNGIVLHLAASTSDKCLHPSKWQRVIGNLLRETDRPLILIGSSDETNISHDVLGVLPVKLVEDRVLNLTGQTKVSDLFPILQCSALLIGADSSPVHVAALVGTPVLNLSFAATNFWETGPKSLGSRIFWQARPDTMSAEAVTEEACRMLSHQAARYSRAECAGSPLELYHELVSVEDHEWDMICAIYLGSPFPALTDAHRDQTFLHSIKRLDEANELAMQQLQSAVRPGASREDTSLLILDRCDQIFQMLGDASPEVGVITRWFQAERIHLGPDSFASMVNSQLDLHKRLEDIIRVYRPRIFEGALAKEHGSDSIILE